MDVFEVRSELRRMCRRDLFKLAASQRISKCVINDGVCCFHLHYKELNFCVSEILGESCQVEKSKTVDPDNEEINLSPPLIPGMDSILPGRKTNEFGVYYRDSITRSIAFLGKVIERRRKERVNNFSDLLKKAIRDFSDCVKDPSTIFLLGS
jgi:hypothetical protein